MRRQSIIAGCVALFSLEMLNSQEIIAPQPRTVEVLTVMPREATGPIPEDPPYVHRGALRDDGTYELPLGRVPFEINKRQLELLRSLDNFKLPDGDVPGLDPNALRHVIGPEPLTIMPREVKK